MSTNSRKDGPDYEPRLVDVSGQDEQQHRLFRKSRVEGRIDSFTQADVNVDEGDDVEDTDEPRRGLLGSIAHELSQWKVTEAENPAEVVDARREVEEARLGAEAAAATVQQMRTPYFDESRARMDRGKNGHFVARTFRPVTPSELEPDFNVAAARSAVASNAEEPPTDLANLDLEDGTGIPMAIGQNPAYVFDDFESIPEGQTDGYMMDEATGKYIRNGVEFSLNQGKIFGPAGESKTEFEKAHDRVRAGSTDPEDKWQARQFEHAKSGRHYQAAQEAQQHAARSQEADAAAAARSSRFGGKPRPLGK